MGYSKRHSIFLMALFITAVLYFGTFHRTGVQEWWEVKMNKPRYIFISLGAGRGEIVDVFLQNPLAKHSYDFPRPQWATHQEAEIFLFEANPVFNPSLIEAKQYYEDHGLKVSIFPSTLVSAQEGIRKFFPDTVNQDDDFWGSSIYSAHPDAVSYGKGSIDLVSIDIARWLILNTSPRDYVVVKMDLEGAEFEVIPRLAEMSAWVVVDHLFMAWHQVEMTGGTDDELKYRRSRAEEALTLLEKKGMNVTTFDLAAHENLALKVKS